MRIELRLPERIGRETERLADELGTPVPDLCARAVEDYIKRLSQQRAIETIDSLLRSPSKGTGDAPVR